MKLNRIQCLVLGVFIAISSVQASWKITSPSGQVEAEITMEENGSLRYDVKLDGQAIVYSSPLGVIVEGHELLVGLKLIEASSENIVTDQYRLASGKQLECRDSGNERFFQFQSKKGDRVKVVFRAYDDAIAFRYFVDIEGEGKVKVLGEKTGFKLPVGVKSWMHPYDKVTKWSPGYETYYENGIASGSSCGEGKNGWAFPCLFEMETGWALITEAGMTAGYCAMHLENDEGSALYTLRMPEKEEAFETCEAEPELDSSFETPWRVVLVGDELADIVESSVITSLNPPKIDQNFDWVVPGRSSWSWCYENDSPQNYEQMLPYIDLSAEMGWEYFLVDANWNIMKGGDLEQLVDYAGSKGVGILVWYNSGGSNNQVTEQPRDIMCDDEARRKAFEWLEEIGVKGVKVDFFQSDKPKIIQQYFDILTDAADNEILVNFHGCTLPRGWRRTYPNLMTMEAVKGAECYLFAKDYPVTAPSHNTILPFTRNVVGPMDYTPVTFSDNTLPHVTSYVHELALSIVFESGLLHLADCVEGYTSLPQKAKEFLMEVPTAWDETLLLDGYPGEFVVVARRKGDQWYLAGINGLDHPKILSLTLPEGFNSCEKSVLFEDGKSAKDISIKQGLSLVNNGTLNVRMGKAGGFVMKL